MKQAHVVAHELAKIPHLMLALAFDDVTSCIRHIIDNKKR